MRHWFTGSAETRRTHWQGASAPHVAFVLALCAASACAASVCSVTSLAAAQDVPADPSRDAEARGLFEAGRVAFADGRFEDALGHFRHAYELSHRPELLYNIATAQDRLRRDADALASFEAYLAALPEAPNRPEVDGRIAVLREALAQREQERASVPDPVQAPPPASGPSIVWSWVTGGAALALGGVAIGLWVAANDQYGALERGCLAMRGGCTPDEVGASGVEGLVTATNVFFVASLVLVGATAIVLPLELTSGGSTSSEVALRVGPGGLSLAGTF